MSLLILILTLGLAHVHGHRVPVIGAPTHHRPFTLYMRPDDHLGTVAQCMKRVHAKGGGVCKIIAGTLTAGRTTVLYQQYSDTWLELRQ